MKGAWFASSMAGQVLGALAGLGTNVAYSRLLSVEAVGVIAIANGLSMWLMVAMDRGLVTWSTQALARSVVSRARVFVATTRSAAPPLAVGVIAASLLALSDYADSTVSSTAWLVLPLGVSIWVYQVGLAITQGEGRPHKRAVGIATNGLLTLVLTLAALAVDRSVWAAIVASALAYILVGGWLLVSDRQDNSSIPPRNPRVADIRRMARPLFAGNIATYSIGAGDVVIAGVIMSASDVGVYQIAKKVAQFAAMPLLSVVPMVTGRLARMSQLQRDRAVANLFNATLVMYVVGSLGGWIVLPTMLPRVFGQDYADAWPVVLILLASGFLQFLKEIAAASSISVGAFVRPAAVSMLPPAVVLLVVGAAALFSTEMTESRFAMVMAAAFAAGSLLMLAPHKSSGSLGWHIRMRGVLISTVVLATAFTVLVAVGEGI